jgi:hypothetical protein
MPIRRLNYTKRRKLNRDQARIRLSPPEEGQPRSFVAELDLPGDLPGSARVFVEAYRTSPAARMRFAFGTVDALRHPQPEELRLSEFPDDLPPLFRVKVTDATDRRGTLLADAQRIRPQMPDEQPDHRRGILYTTWRNNDGLVWELEFDDARGPVLYIDERADPLRELPSRTDFKALVYPEIMRRALTAAFDDEHSFEDPESWQARWVSFPRLSFGFTEPIPPDDREAWIESAVRWCSRKARFIDAIAPKEAES